MQPRWRENTTLTLSGSAAEVVTGLVGNITAEFPDRGAHRDHGRCDRQYHRHHHRLGGDLDQRQLQTDTVTVDGDRAGAETALTLAGSAAETVTGLVGDITAGH